MDDGFFNWIEKEFRFSNLKKYHKYFDRWFKNLTKDQLHGLKNQYDSIISKFVG